MNSTTLLYTPVEQAFLTFPGLVVSPLLSLFIYRYARRRLDEMSTSKSRAHIFYRLMSGIFLGQFLCHTFFKATIYSVLGAEIMACFVLIGYIIVEATENLARVCYIYNSDLTDAPDYKVPDDYALNKTSMTQNTYIEATDVSNTDFSDTVFRQFDAFHLGRKKLAIMVLLFICFAMVCFADGMFLIQRFDNDSAVIISCFYINTLAMSLGVYGAMIHAKLHNVENTWKRRGWWTLCTAIWSVMLFSCSIPVLARMQQSAAIAVVANPAMASFYAVAAGGILWLHQYFRSIKLESTDRTETCIGLVALVAAGAQSAVTGVFI